MQSNYKLNCLVSGDDPTHIFPIKIACTDTAGDLKEFIKEKKKHAFRDVDADKLILWNVENLLVDDAFKGNLKLCLEKKGPLSAMDEMLDVFDNKPPLLKHLHIVVDRPAVFSVPQAVDLSINLNCLVLGDDDPAHIFEIKIAPTESVSALKEFIKEKKKHAFCDVDADTLILWKVDDLPVNGTFRDKFSSLRVVLDHEEPLSPVAEMCDVFDKTPPRKHLHVVVQRPIPTPVPVGPCVGRVAYLKNIQKAPSSAGEPSEFSKQQQDKEYLCSRPRGAADPLPVTLLEPIFAQFVDDCQTYQPTHEDNRFVRELSDEMCSFYANESERMDRFKQLLCSYGINLNATAVPSTSCKTDGHMSYTKKFVEVILEGKNEISKGGAEPFLESMVYYRKFLEHWNREGGVAHLQSVIPCFHLIVVGPCIAVSGVIFTEKVQCDILAPIIPLFCHSTDHPMLAMAARMFGAFKIAVQKLKTLYSNPIPQRRQGDSIDWPYPRDYADSTGQTHKISYHQTQGLRQRFIFFGETVNHGTRRKICIKFVRHYSPEAHRFCADRGHAPELITYKCLPSGWNMVVMEFIDVNDCYPRRSGSYRQFSEMDVSARRPLKKLIHSLIRNLHNEGYVHGDLRDTNFLTGDDGQFMLLDFDWAGRIGEARYPMNVNYESITRPAGARDGLEILPEHDLEMLGYLFNDDMEAIAGGVSAMSLTDLSRVPG